MLRKHLTILTAYTALALVMTFPLALNFAAAIPGVEGDAASYLWALGWAKTALVDLHVNPFRSDYVFYPLGGATQLLWAVSLIAFVSIPLQLLFGLIAAHNVMYLAATVVTAYGTFLLAEFVIRNSKFKMANYEFRILNFEFVPFVAGLVFAFAPLRLGYGLAFFNLFNTQLIPFYVLFLIRALRGKSWRDAVVAGVLLGLNAYVDFQIAAFLVLFTGVYSVYDIIACHSERSEGFRKLLARRFAPLSMTVQGILLIALVSLLVAAPMLALVANDFAMEGGNYIRVYKLEYSAARSYDLLSFFVPNARSTLYADAPLKIAGVNAAVNANDVSALSPDRQAFVGYIVLALAAYAVVRQWRAARFWFFAAILFALLSLGPSLHVFGRDTGIPLPYLALHELPIVNHIRIPMRYGSMINFALAMLVAIGIRNSKFEIRNSKLATAVCCLLPVAILLEYAALPYPIQPIPIPRLYHDLARVPGDFTVLEIPAFNWRYAAATEVYQAMHGKRILRAYTNRIAPGLAEYFAHRGTPIVVRSLRALEGVEPGGLAPEDIGEDKRVRDEVVRFYDLHYAVLHRQFLKADAARAIDAYLRDALTARVIYDDGETVGYAVPRVASATSAVQIDLRENVGQMYAGRGWQFEYPPANWEGTFDFVWARGTQSEIYFRVDRAAERVLTLHAYTTSPQRVGVFLNGARVGEIALTNEWRDYHITLPARAGMNQVRLDYSAELKETIGMTTISIE